MPEQGASKLLGLELLRFTSALAVLMFHYRHFALIGGVPSIAPSDQPGYSLLWPLYDYGQFGVQIFWGISGYIFFRKYGAMIHERAISAGRFFWLRFSRLYPLHLVTLITVAGLQIVHRQVAGVDFVYASQNGADFGLHLLMATHWGAPTPFTFNGLIWSVSAEIAVYAGFFLVLHRIAPSIALCMGVITAGLVAQMAGVNWVSVTCMTYFFAGGLAALAPHSDQVRRWATVGLVALIATCALAGVLGDRSKLPMILLAAGPCLLLLLSKEWRWLERWERPIQAFGNLTYSSYLLHFPLQLALAIGVASTGIAPSLASPWFVIAYLGTTFAAAAISYRNFELPAQSWVRQRTIGRPAA